MFNAEVGISQFVERYKNRPNPVDNASLHAGSPMHYYCRHCGAHIATLPETHRQRVKTVCQPCNVLVDHGLIDRAVRTAERADMETQGINLTSSEG